MAASGLARCSRPETTIAHEALELGDQEPGPLEGRGVEVGQPVQRHATPKEVVEQSGHAGNGTRQRFGEALTVQGEDLRPVRAAGVGPGVVGEHLLEGLSPVESFIPGQEPSVDHELLPLVG